MFPTSARTQFFLAATTMATAAAAATLPKSIQKPLRLGDTLCLEGFVVDLDCIQRDTLHLDDNDDDDDDFSIIIETHGLNCPLDVDRCVHSGCEILLSSHSPSRTLPDDDDYQYYYYYYDDSQRKHHPKRVRLDPTGNSLLLATAVGFRATVTGTVIDLGDVRTRIPPTVRPISIGDSSAGCDAHSPPHSAVRSSSSSSSSSYTKMVFWHGSLMIVGWGWILPSGVVFARFYKHGERASWLRWHRALQSLGLAVASIAWIIALVNFDVFGGSGGGGKDYVHGVLGTVLMALGWIQPMNAFARPRNDEDVVVGGVKSTARIVWEGVHKSVGYLAVLLAVGNIVVGTTLVPMPRDRWKFQLGYGVGAVGAVVILVVALVVDGRRWRRKVLEERKEGRPSFLGPLLGTEDLVPL
ncbi:hypothetical protein ACHAXS_014091 [Conticribra weissflogii]